MPEAVRRELEAAAPAAAAAAASADVTSDTTAAAGDTHPDAVDSMPSLSAGILPGPVHPYISSTGNQQQQQQQQQQGGIGDRELPLVETQPAVQPSTEQPAAASVSLGTAAGTETNIGGARKPIPVIPDDSSSNSSSRQNSPLQQQQKGDGAAGDTELPALLEVLVQTEKPFTKQSAAAGLGLETQAGTAAGTEAETGETPYIKPPSSSTAPGPNHPILGAAALTGWDPAESSAVASLPAAATAATGSNAIAATAATGSRNPLLDGVIVLGPAGRSQPTYASEVGKPEAVLPAATTAATAATTAANDSSDIINDIAIGGGSSGIKPFPPQEAYDSNPISSSSGSSSSSSSSGIKAFPPQLLPAVGTDPGLGPEQLQVLSVWYNKFCSETEAQLRASLDQGCAEGMIFEGNFIKV
jgi:hypothetical protein